MSVPQDPYILLSFINTKLRDEYANLDELCRDIDINRVHLKSVLSSIDYSYIKEKNQFIPKL